MSTINALTRTRYPRLTVAGFSGTLLLVAALFLLVTEGRYDGGVATFSVRVGVVGFLLLVFATAGYVSLTVFKHRPGE